MNVKSLKAKQRKEECRIQGRCIRCKTALRLDEMFQTCDQCLKHRRYQAQENYRKEKEFRENKSRACVRAM